ncbi:MAG: methyltransferase MtaB domain-containing protein [Thermofilaceae archaeon]
MRKYTQLAYKDANNMVFGKALHPLRYGLGLSVGECRVIPELKYWPNRTADESGRLVAEFVSITRDALERAIDLGVQALQLETELNHVATLNPRLAREIVEAQKGLMESYHKEYGIALALRVTIADVRWTREVSKEEALTRMLEAFEETAAAGVDVVSIESIGGKEVSDYSIIRNDIKGIILSLGVLAPRDVEKLWKEIFSITSKYGVLAGGDSACGFSNTAMKLAGGFKQKMLPHVLAAVVRAMSAVRTLKAFEAGAQGPGKDCAYENVIVKAITGYPMAMEGKSAAIAHSSLVGNVAAAACDLWSNEQVENLKLFGGTAPQVCLEILYYDCEVMNAALEAGYEENYRELLVSSNAWRDPQALVLAPRFAWEIAKAIVMENDDYRRVLSAGLRAVELINREWKSGKLKLDRREVEYIHKLDQEFKSLPDDEETFLSNVATLYESKIKVKLSDYL